MGKLKEPIKPKEIVPDNPLNKTLSKAEFIAQENKRKENNAKIKAYAEELKAEGKVERVEDKGLQAKKIEPPPESGEGLKPAKPRGRPRVIK